MAAAGSVGGCSAATDKDGPRSTTEPDAQAEFYGLMPSAAQADTLRSADVQTALSTPKAPASLEQLAAGGAACGPGARPGGGAPGDPFEGFLALALGELQRSVAAEHARAVQAIARAGASTDPALPEACFALGVGAGGGPLAARRCSECSIEEVQPDSAASSETERMAHRAHLHEPPAVPQAALRAPSDGVSSAPLQTKTFESLGACLRSDSPQKCGTPERPGRPREEQPGNGRSLAGLTRTSRVRPANLDPEDREAGGDSPRRVRSGRGGVCGRHNHRTLTTSSAMSEASVLGTKRRKSAEGPRMQHVSSENLDGEFVVLEVWQKAMDAVSKQGTFKRSRHATSGSQSENTASSEAESKSPDAETAERSPWKKLRWWLMSPNCKRRLIWDALSVLCILYDLVMAPLEFLNERYYSPSPMHWIIMMFWTLDIFASCTSGYTLPNGTDVYRLRSIWKRYASSWLLPDAAMVGADWTEALFPNKLPTGWRLVRMMRLLRLLRVRSFLSFLVMRMSERAALVFSSAQTLLAILFLAHGMGCLWAGLGRSEGAQGWVSHAAEGGELTSEQTYLLAMHWALTNFAGTVDLGPRSPKERVYAIFSLVFGFLVASAFVSIITTNMTRLSIIASRRAAEFKELNTYLHERGISRSLQSRVILNAQHAIAEQEAHIPEESVKLLEDVSEPLRRELHFEIYADHLSVHPLFDLLRHRSQEMKRICHDAVFPVLVSENEVIFSVDEVPSEPPHMIFLEKGLLKYQLDGEAIQDVRPGQWIAEQVLWTDWVYQGTLRSVTPCRLLMLNSVVFQQIVSTKFMQGTLSFEVTKYAAGFLKMLNKSRHRVRSDLGSPDACVRLTALCSGANLQDSLVDPPKRRMSGSFSINELQDRFLRAARRPEEDPRPGAQQESEPKRSSKSRGRVRLPWRPQSLPVAPENPAAEADNEEWALSDADTLSPR